MLIKDLLKEIKSNNTSTFSHISFMSTSFGHYSIKPDYSLFCHPHDNKATIEKELKDKYRFVYPIYCTPTELSSRPKMSDIFIGFLYSNTTNLERFIKDRR